MSEGFECCGRGKDFSEYRLKGTVYPKMKMLSFTHPHVRMTCMTFFVSSVEQKLRYYIYKNVLIHTMNVIGV